MIAFLKGKTLFAYTDCVYFDVNGVGYKLFVSHPELFPINEEKLVFTYKHKREDDEYLVGFISNEEKKCFEILIKVQGIGPKSALAALRDATPQEIILAIETSNISFLKKLGGIGKKTANQIILDLKDTLYKKDSAQSTGRNDAYLALKGLGFKPAQINKVFDNIPITVTDEKEIIKIALKSLRSV